MKSPTKAQWDEIAEAFDTPRKKRNLRQISLTDDEHHRGICDALHEIGYPWYWFFRSFRPEILVGDTYFWPLTPAGDRQRAFFCCMMAAITEAGDMESMIEEV